MLLDISLIGYGKMGKMIASMAEEHGCRVKSIIDPSVEGCEKEIRPEILGDVCLDFSLPDTVLENIRKISAAGKKHGGGHHGLEQQASRGGATC